MEHFGYKESLARSIGSFGSFAAGVSYISILTGTFQLFYFGFGTAGPAYLGPGRWCSSASWPSRCASWSSPLNTPSRVGLQLVEDTRQPRSSGGRQAG